MSQEFLRDNLDDKQLKQYLNLLVNDLVDRTGSTISQDDKTSLIDCMVNMFKFDQNKQEKKDTVPLKQLQDPKFLKNLLDLILKPELIKQFRKENKPENKKDDKEEKNEKILDLILKLLFNKDKKRELTLSDKKALNKLMQEFDIDFVLKKAGFKNMQAPKPKPGAKSDKEEEEQFDINTGLLGLVNTRIAGAYPALIRVALGNLMGITDQNPNQGLDVLSNTNDPNQEYGLSQNAVTNFLMSASGAALTGDERLTENSLFVENTSFADFNDSLKGRFNTPKYIMQ